MRRLLFILALVLAACGGDGGDVTTAPELIEHVPAISNLKLTPDNALYMQGDGSVQVTAEFAYADLGRDLETLRVEMSDGTSMTIALADQFGTRTGTVSTVIDMNTAEATAYDIEIWLIDRAGQISNHLDAQFNILRHAPEISGVEFSSYTFMYMQGGGSVEVTADFFVRDIGEDIETLNIEQPNGEILSFDLAGHCCGQTGTITRQLEIATTEVGPLVFDIWLVDVVGDSGPHLSAEILISEGILSWTERATALPFVLNDVSSWHHDCCGFIAVGDGGTILSSDDGVTWMEEDSGTTVDLHAIVCGILIGSCYVVGDEGTILRGGSGNWESYFDGPDDISLTAIYDNPFAHVQLAGGFVTTTATACVLQRDYYSDLWTTVEPTGDSGQRITGIGSIFRLFDGSILQLVATVEATVPAQGKVLVSADGLNWVEVLISDTYESTYSIGHYDGHLWVGGSYGHIYSSPDGVNWTKHETPASSSNLVAMLAADGLFVALGFSETIGLQAQVGVMTGNGGQTWQTFVIGEGFEPRGLALSNGRWVSVGQSLSDPGKGAIYTTQ